MQIPAPGMLIAGKYRVLCALGEGGMGAVFEVEHVLTLKRAALKWLHPQVLSAEVGHARLLQEARATSRVRHHNVIDLYDVLDEDGSLFLVMELLEGELLGAWLAGAPHSFAELLALLLPAMEGVAAAHAVGVVHRDIKPDNIFVARAAGDALLPKVIDFGISRTFDGERLTRSGMAMGTPRYVSFEQLRGERDVDGRSDVYAFGVMLYEALLGRAPYEASSFAEQAIRFVTSEPPRPRALRAELPQALEDVILKAIARDREVRHASMRALIDALSACTDPKQAGALALWQGRPALDAAPTVAAAREVGTRPAAPVAAVPSLDRAPRRRARRPLRGWAALGLSMLCVTLLAHAVRVRGTAHGRELPAVVLPESQRSPTAAGIARGHTDPGMPVPATRPAAALSPQPTSPVPLPVARPRRRTRIGVDAHGVVPGDAGAAPPPAFSAADPRAEGVASPRAGHLRRHEF